MDVSPSAGEASGQEGQPSGLTSEEASRRLARDGPNRLPALDLKSPWRIAWSVATQPMFLLLLFTAAVYAALGDVLDAATLGLSVLAVGGLSFYQEQRTTRVLNALKDLSSPRCSVMRDGRSIRVPSQELVCGDLLIVNEGDRLAADALLAESNGLSVDESLLTGEAHPVLKSALRAAGDGDEAQAQLHAGSLAVQGDGLAVVTATGAKTALGRIGGSLSRIQPIESRLQSELRRLVQAVAVLALITCLAAATLYALREGSWTAGLLVGLTLAMALIPEEFAVVWSVMLALGAWRLSQHQVLTRQPQAIESLGTVTVLCVDKTGTLTHNRMTLARAHDGAGQVALSAGAGSPLLSAARLASVPAGAEPMDRAIFQAAPPPPEETVLKPGPRLGVRAGRPWVSHWWEDGEEGWRVFVKGAAESVLAQCEPDGGRVDRMKALALQWSAEGMRVLAVAQGGAPHPGPDGGLAPDARLTAAGLLGFMDPLREEVPGAVRQCHEAGVRVLMITGDSPVTAVAIARQAGLPVDGKQEIFTGAQLAGLSDLQLRQAVGNAAVFARMDPAQKLRVVQALQHSGEVVAMTGDGVNDAPALRAAHIGVAMGRRGTDVAREAAALVLLDDNFASLVDAVRGGRRIFVNLQKALGYLFAVHVPIVGISLMPVLLGGPVLLLPLHVVLLELIIDPACSLVFEAEPEPDDCMRTPPRAASTKLFSPQAAAKALGVGLIALCATLAVQWLAHRQGASDGLLRLLSLSSIVAANLAMLAWFRGLRPDHDHANRVFDALVLGVAGVWSVLLAVPATARLFGLPVLAGEPLAVALSLAVGLAVVALWRLARARRSSRGR